MPSVAGLLERHELAARRRADGLREQADRIQGEAVVRVGDMSQQHLGGCAGALVILLSEHQTGDTVSYAQMSEGLRHFGLTIKRTAEILDQLGLLDDDRVPVFESWLAQRLDGLADGIRHDVEDWLRTLRDGGPRSQPREQGTAMKYLAEIRPVLLDWSGRLDHLREVTRTDILAVRDQLEGSKRHPLTRASSRRPSGGSWSRRTGS